ncbi:MAG: hypothetical protein ACYC3X_28615 [Pirellulaceae bacterium]
MTTPAWRSFEELVSRIEKALAGENVKVTSPDFVPCITTGTPREVDASIRTRVGSAEILVTVECRNRVAVQDVTWIEQLAAKKKNIGAAKTIAVAASGFSAEAIRIARENAIDLRILDEITVDDIKSWMPLQAMVHVFKDCGLNGSPEIAFFAEPGDEQQEAGGHSAAQPIFRSPSGEPLSLNDIWLRADDQLKIFDKVPMDNNDHFVEVMIEPSDTLQLCTSQGIRRVKSITMPLRLRWKHEFFPLSDATVVRYGPADSADVLPEQVRVEFETKQASSINLRVGFQLQQGDAKMHISGEVTMVERPRAIEPAAGPVSNGESSPPP